MMPSSLGGGNGSAKHQQQFMQSASMLPSTYSFLPSVFANAQLDAPPVFRPPEPNLSAVYLSQLAAAAALTQGITSQNGASGGVPNEQRDEIAGKNHIAETAASTSSEAVTSSCNDESPISPRPDDTTEQRELELSSERNSTDKSTAKLNIEDTALTTTQQNDNVGTTASAAELPQMDLSKLISDFFPGFPNGPSALNMAALTQRMPSMLEQMQFMSQYFSPGNVEESLRVLATLGSDSGSPGIAPPASTSSGSLLGSSFTGNVGHLKDTYCEMCDKNFCNRYFLRTHKWKKHGVPLPGKNSPPEYNVSALTSPTSSQNLPLDLPATSTGMNLSPAEFLAALCSQNAVADSSQISPTKTTASSQPTSVIVNCSSNSESPPAKRALVDDEANKEDITSTNAARSGSVKVDDEAVSIVSASSQLPNTGDLFAMIARQAQENAYAQDVLSDGRIQMQQQSSPSKHSSSSSGKESCEMCGQEYESRAMLQQHLLLQHNILNSLLTPFSLLPLGPLQPQQQPQQQQQQPQACIPGTDADRPRNSAVMPAVITPPINASRQPKKQYSTGKNYCDVCNKEVCNKYFLRTHMLKMHGIVIDEHKTIIANIDTLEKEKSGTIAFRCDICNTNVGQTRESLKQHKQDVHNVVSLPTARGHRGSIGSTSSTATASCLSQALRASDQSGNHTDQMRCPLCDVRTSGMTIMQKHLSEIHNMEMNVDSLEAILKEAYEIKTGQSASAALNGSLAAEIQQQMMSRSGEFVCSQCAEVFSDQVHFQLHMIHNHPMVIQSLQEKSSSATVTAQNMGELHSKYGCRSPSVKVECADSESKPVEDESRHSEDTAHQVAVQETRKPFDCPVSWCPRRYRDPVMLNKHVSVVHQWRLKFSPKNGNDKPRGVIAPSKLFKWKRRYICLYGGCKRRFWSRDGCHEHILTHFSNSVDTIHADANGSMEQKVPGRDKDADAENGGSRNINDLMGVEKEKVLRNVAGSSGNVRERERNNRTPGSSSSDSDLKPEGYGQPSGNAKPYTVQTFLMREQAMEQSPSSTNEPITAAAAAPAPAGAVFSEMVAHLPVRNTVREMVRVNMELVPTAQQISPILHL